MSHPSWQPSASIEHLRLRAQLLARIREFFIQRFYLEVETPTMAHYGVTDPYLSNIQAQFRKKDYPLQTSPEYHMKRLLAAGSGPIFQMAKVFRDDELGRWHNPEFTLLEWYQLDVDHHQLMDEVDSLLQTILGTKPMLRQTYQQAFLDACQLDPFAVSILELQAVLERYDLGQVLDPKEQDKDQYLFLLMSHIVEPFLGQRSTPTAVYHFPPSQASLAQIQQGVAERFEVYYQGVELANGFHELRDGAEQIKRFEQDLAGRMKLGVEPVAIDPWLIQALEFGIPACSGVALGIDRLVALALGCSSLAQVLSFDWGRA